MTRTTKDQRLSTSGCHNLDPIRFLSAFILVEIFECANVMHLNALRQAGRPAMLTDLCQESLFEF